MYRTLVTSFITILAAAQYSRIAAAPRAAAPVSMTPASGFGLTQIMTFVIRDSRGYQNISQADVRFGDPLDGSPVCQISYTRKDNAISVLGDNPSAATRVTLGGGGAAGNGRCSVTGAGSSAEGNASVLTLKLNMTFAAGFAGNKGVFLAARDAGDSAAEFVPVGVWRVPGSALGSVAVTGMSPASGNGRGTPFHFVFTDNRGYQDLGQVHVLVNDSLNQSKACYFTYSQPDQTLYLLDDTGQQTIDGIRLNGEGSVHNSQCAILSAGSSATGSGSMLTLTVNIAWNSSFTGKRIFYALARDSAGGSPTGWQAVGSFASETVAASGVTRLEQNDPSITYTGTWYPNTESPNSGGSATTTNEKLARASITFNGTGIAWVGLSDPYSGISQVYLDGTLSTIDTYAGTTKYQQVLFAVHGLPAGNHTLSIEVLHQRDNQTSGSWIWIDAFDIDNGTGVTGGVSAGAGRVEQNDPALSFTGAWFPKSISTLSGGSAVEAVDAGSRATITFTGSGIRWISYRDAYSGIAKVYLDGSLTTTVDNYTVTDQPQATGYEIGGLASALHSLTIEATGTHNPASGGSWIWVDAFDVMGGGPSLSAQIGGANAGSVVFPAGNQPSPITVMVIGNGGTLPFNLTFNSTPAWLQVSPTSGTASASGTPITVSVNPSAFGANPAPGPYSGSIVISSPGSSNVLTLPVTTTVVASTPCVAPVSTVNFSAVQNTPGSVSPASFPLSFSAATCPSPITVASTPPSWLNVSVAGQTATLTAVPGNMAAGSYSSPVSFSSAGFTTSVTVKLNITAPTPCTLALNPALAMLGSSGTSSGGFLPLNSQTFTITSSGSCSGATWSVSSSTAGMPSSGNWLNVTGGANGGAPSSTVTYTALSNPHPTPRTATITVTSLSAGSVSFSVTEAGDGEPLLQRQVRALYQQLLGRDPDGGGFTFWSGPNSSGLGTLVDQFLESPEGIATDWTAMTVYQAAIGTFPTFAQWASAVAQLRGGATAASLLTSIRPGVTGANLYQNLLGRAPNASESGQSVAGAYGTILSSMEFQNLGPFHGTADHSNPLWVRLVYYVTLSRDPDASGFQFWLAQANLSGGGIFYNGPLASRLAVLGPGAPNVGMVGSPEFQGLFQ